MITGYTTEHGSLRPVADPLTEIDKVAWIDLFNPDKEEEHLLETLLGIDIPTREEMEEIEISSRLYYDDGAAFMTVTLLSQSDSPQPEISPVSFVLSGDCLITVRYTAPRAFQTFPVRAQQTALGCSQGDSILIALLEAIIDRLADVLERISKDVSGLSHQLFEPASDKPMSSEDLQSMLQEIGRKGDLTANLRECLGSMQRMFGFLGHVFIRREADKDLKAHIKTLSRDAESLTDHVAFLDSKISFLLDGTLGLISIQQNAIIKIFSVAAVVFLPPTLVASIYGMNFTHMPELRWLFGYPWALLVMILAAILPYLYFKRRGWL